MTTRHLLELGATATRLVRRTLTADETRLLWNQYSTEYRYEQLVERLRARRSLIRTANRKFRRQCGMDLRNA